MATTMHVDADPSVAEMKKALDATVEDGGKKKTMWRMTMDTLGMADGKSTKDDVIVKELDSAVDALKAMVLNKNQAISKKDNEWDFPHTPLDEFNATLDDLFTAFIKWAKDKETEKVETSCKTLAEKDDATTATAPSFTVETPCGFNVSKAFRRLESYVSWMEEAANREKGDCAKLFEAPLTSASVNEAAVAMGMFVTHDKQDRLVWWMDFSKMDAPGIKAKTVPIKNLLRYVVWSTHLAMFDQKVQDNGMIIIEEVANMGFIQMITLFPSDLATSFDRLTIGVLPIKMKYVLISGAMSWMKVLMALMKPFMSKKMRSRMHMISKHETLQEEPQKRLGGKEYILNGCCGLQGSLDEDIAFGKYLSLL